MSHFESPPPASADFPREKSPEPEIPVASSHRANCTSSSQEVQPEDRHAKVMENFKGMIFKISVASCATKSLSPMQRSLIEQRLDEFFPSFRSPDHPPYSAMIEASIQKLNEEGASTEEAISQFIRKEYPDLPWAHDTLLKHHLENLCENGIIVKAYNGPCCSTGADSSLSLSPSFSPSPSPSSSSSSSSSLWSSSSCCSSPRPKRKRLLYTTRRKKQGRKRGSTHKRRNKGKVNRLRCVQVQKRGRGRPPKKDVLDDETERNAEHLMLEEKSEETEGQKKSKEECTDMAECVNQVRGKRRKIRKQGQTQETRLVIDFQLDKNEDTVDEEQRDQQAQENIFIRNNNQAEAIEIQSQTQEYHNEVKEEQEGCQVIEQIRTEVIPGLQGEEAEGGEQEAFLKETRKVAAQERCRVVEEESVLERTNFRVIKEQRQMEGHDIVSEQDQRNKQKRKSQLHNRGAKEKKAHLKPTRIPGKSRGRPRKRCLLVETTQPHAEQMKTTDIQDPMLEGKTEVPEEKCKTNKELAEMVEDNDQLQRNICKTLQSIRAEETYTENEFGKSGLVAEANTPIKQCYFVMEGKPQKDESIEDCDEQKEHENFEGIEEQSQLEEHKIVPQQDQSNGQKRKGQPLKRSVKRRKVDLKPTCIPGRGRGRPRKKDLWVEKTQPNEEQMETTDIQDPMIEEKTEVPEPKYETNKELTEVVEDHNQSQGNMQETLEGSPVEETEMVKEIGKSGPVSEENKLVKQRNSMKEGEPQKDEDTKGGDEQKEHENFLGVEEKVQLEEPNMVPEQGQRKKQTRKGQLLNGGVKGRKVHLKRSHIQGRGRGRPRKKDLLVENTQAHAEPMETTDIQDPMLEEKPEVPDENYEINKECSEVVEDCNKLKGNMHGTLEWSQAEETKMVKEVRKPGPVAEENNPIKQCIFVMEGEQQNDWGAEGFDEQNEPEKEQKQSAEEKDEMTFGENQPQRQENEEQNLQLEKNMESVTGQEVEMPKMRGQNTRIQENIQPEGEYQSIIKSLLWVDVAERSMDRKAINLLEESFGSVLEEGKEISSTSTEQQKEMAGEETVLEIDGKQTEQKPESSNAGKSELKSVERSSQPECPLEEIQHAEEKPQHGQLCSQAPKSFSSCGML